MLSLASHIERWVFIASNCVWGAELMLDGMTSLLPYRMQISLLNDEDGPAGRRILAIRRSASVLLATGGLYYQLVACADQRLPFTMRAVLVAPLVGERWLSALTYAVRGPLVGLTRSE